MEWVLYPLVVLGVAGFRSLPRLRVNRGALSLLVNDTWFHLLFAEEMAANGHRVPKRIGGFLLSENVAYPPLMHWVLSYLPRRWRERTEPLWGGLCDGLVAAGLLGLGIHGFPGGTVWTGLLAVLVYVVTPGMMGVGWGPRVLHGTPRAFGQMLFFASTVSFLLYRSTGEWGWLAGAVLAGSWIFVSSLFGVQAFVFMNGLVAVLLRSWEPLGLVAAAFGVSLAWFGGYSWHLRRSHLDMLAAMRKSLGRGGFDGTIQARNQWRELLRFPVYLLKNPQKARMLAFKENTWLILLIQMPLVPACFLLGGPGGGGGEGLLREAGLYVWAGLAVFAATSWRPLLFLGEAERYVEHGVPLLGLTLAAAAVRAPGGWMAGVMGAVVLVSAAVTGWHALDFVRRGRRNLAKQEQVRKVLHWIQRNGAGKRFAVLPRNGLNLLIPYFTKGSVLFGRWRGNSPPDVMALRNPELEEFARHREGLLARHGIDYVVAALRSRESPGLRGLFKEYAVVFQNEDFAILDCRRNEEDGEGGSTAGG